MPTNQNSRVRDNITDSVAYSADSKQNREGGSIGDFETIYDHSEPAVPRTIPLPRNNRNKGIKVPESTPVNFNALNSSDFLVDVKQVAPRQWNNHIGEYKTIHADHNSDRAERKRVPRVIHNKPQAKKVPKSSKVKPIKFDKLDSKMVYTFDSGACYNSAISCDKTPSYCIRDPKTPINLYKFCYAECKSASSVRLCNHKWLKTTSDDHFCSAHKNIKSLEYRVQTEYKDALDLINAKHLDKVKEFHYPITVYVGHLRRKYTFIAHNAEYLQSVIQRAEILGDEIHIKSHIVGEFCYKSTGVCTNFDQLESEVDTKDYIQCYASCNSGNSIRLCKKRWHRDTSTHYICQAHQATDELNYHRIPPRIPHQSISNKDMDILPALKYPVKVCVGEYCRNGFDVHSLEYLELILNRAEERGDMVRVFTMFDPSITRISNT